MKWPWKRDEARKAREQAEIDLAETRAETPKVRALADSLRELRERNHFGESIAHSFRGDS